MNFTELMKRRGIWAALLTLIAMAIPSMALAAGSEAKVVLNFSGTDNIYLYVSLGLGVIAIAVGYYLRAQVLAMNPGSEAMQEVGTAIHQGAMAYLKRQFGTMIWFVLAIAVILAFIYSGTYQSPMLGILTAVAFIAGVMASYFAGYVGMDMAVRGNTRTAHAALEGLGKSLVVAFRSGAVAGMITVGIGLLGATLIFLFARENAMKMLVGFGFGGSLAALFMRVGGGIFTKAADVGADLVGKVEAGIPEDDPRNPATIADNVGDNVGDCAGMAADIFESYEVTLVAAIVLGAATASIFDQSTWMKLILFALMARGVGIIASIFGIFSVKGNIGPEDDPLKPVRKGFWTSAAIALVGTGVLAYLMIGSDGIKTSRFIGIAELSRDKFRSVQSIVNQYAIDRDMKPSKVTFEHIKDFAPWKELKIPTEQNAMDTFRLASNATSDQLAQIPNTSGYTEVDFNSPEANGLAAMKQSFQPNKPTSYMSLKELVEKTRIYKAKRTTPSPDGTKPPTEDTFYIGSTDQKQLVEDLGPSGAKLDDSFKPLAVKLYGKDETYAVGLPLETDDILYRAQPFDHQVVAMPVADLKTQEDKRKQLSDKLQQLVGLQASLKDAALSANQQEVNKINMELSGMKSADPVRIDTGKVDAQPVYWWQFFVAIAFGILLAFIIEILTDYYVSTHKKPVQEVAGVSTAGPAPMIIAGFAFGLESSVFSVFTIVLSLIVPLILFPVAMYGSYILGFYGIALVGLGLLTTTGYILAMDTFGPISDNAQGVFEMSGAGHTSPEGSRAVQRLDAAGNTTKALTKGFAIATAVVAAVALFHSFVEDAMLTSIGMRLEIPEIFLGLMIGGAAPFLFSAFSINAVGRAAFELINEVRRQFRSDAGIMAGTSKPDYGRCVAIVTAAAQKELLGPGILAIALPVAVGFGFSIGQKPVMMNGGEYNLVGAQALGGFLAGAILTGQLMAVLLANSGGMWDNAKKLIEDGMYGGKGSEAHKAGIVCDTVGDPFKDTAGPALNPLIKVMNLVALLLAPIVIAPHSTAVQVSVTVACLGALAFSIWWSKRGSMASGLNAANAEAAAIPAAAAAPIQAPPKKADSGRRITVEDTETTSEVKPEDKPEV